MNNYLSMMITLDNIRLSKKITVQELCEGICSPRSYSRYLSGDTTITLDVLLMLIDRVRIPLNEFSVLYRRHMEESNSPDAYFVYNMIFGIKENLLIETYKELKVKHISDVSTMRSLPIALILYDYLFLNKSKEESRENAKNILNFEKLVQAKTITQDLVLELALYIYLAKVDELDPIFDYLWNFLKEPSSYQYYFFQYDRVVIIICYTLLKIIELKKELNINNDALKNVFNYSIKYIALSKQTVNDAFLMEYLYLILKKISVPNKYFLYNYVAIILSNYSTGIANYHKFVIAREDLDSYYEVLNDENYLRMPIFSGVNKL